MGPLPSTGAVFPPAPYGPDPNDPAGGIGDGFNVPLLSIATKTWKSAKMQQI